LLILHVTMHAILLIDIILVSFSGVLGFEKTHTEAN
jgi:hypothetical protein